MTVFITGVTGFIGRHFFERLQLQNPGIARILILARNADAADFPGAEILRGSLENIQDFAEQLLSADYVFHLAGRAALGLSGGYREANVQPVQTMVEILSKSRKLRNFIFLSSICAVERSPFDFCRSPLSIDSSPSPRSAYGKSKLDAENVIRAAGIPFTIIRSGWVYGESMREGSHVHYFATQAVKGNSLLFRLAFPGKISIIHVQDLCEALARSIGNAGIVGRTYFAETEGLSLAELLNAVWKCAHGSALTQNSWPKFFTWFRFFHFLLPQSFANLFANYLYAKDPAFHADFGMKKTIRFSEGVGTVFQDRRLSMVSKSADRRSLNKSF